MKLATTLRINMTGAPASPETQGERYRAAIEMAAYADRHGFSIVNVEEHHCAAIGWLPSPLVLAVLVESGRPMSELAKQFETVPQKHENDR